MKRLLPIFLCVVLFFTSVLFASAGDKGKYLQYENGATHFVVQDTNPADLNNDKKTDVRDARIALRSSLNLEELEDKFVKRADVNNDGENNIVDARLILRIALSTEKVFKSETGELKGLMLDDDGNKYNFHDGGRTYSEYFYDGFDLYYSFLDGKLARNQDVGEYSFEDDCKARAKTLNADTLDWKLKQILKTTGTGAYHIFDYIRSNYNYTTAEDDEKVNLVINMLNTRRGSCYHFAALTSMLYEAAGYKTYIVRGSIIHTEGNIHEWTIVQMNDGWFYVDTEYPIQTGGTYKKTDAQLYTMGYRWNFDDYSTEVFNGEYGFRQETLDIDPVSKPIDEPIVSDLTQEDFTVKIGNNSVSVGEDYKTVLENFGEGEVLNIPSCWYDGTDSIITYEYFRVSCYSNNGILVVYKIEILSENIWTTRGISIGDSLKELGEIYGTEERYEAEGLIEYSIDDFSIFFLYEDDLITAIEIVCE
ncbi:MAG TPA: hypothetical protein GXZ23_03305 [Clostridiales bacterium]|nr:hypothetical protein [Clostridiales bacterium]